MSALRLYLIRHGLAVEREEFSGPDGDRPLTPLGTEKTGKVARRLKSLQIRFDHLLSSPLLRARQTAELLQAEKLSSQVELRDFLAPGGSFADGLAWLDKDCRSDATSVALVGHEPDLSQWAEILLWEEARQVLQLKKAGIIGLILPQGRPPVGNSLLFWLSSPGLLL